MKSGLLRVRENQALEANTTRSWRDPSGIIFQEVKTDARVDEAAFAIVIGSGFGWGVGKFFLSLFQNDVAGRLFDTLEEALIWLQSTEPA